MAISEARFIRAETAPPNPGDPCPYCFPESLVERSQLTGYLECNQCFEHWDDRPYDDSHEDDGDWQRDCDVEEAVLHEHFDYYE